MNTGNLTPETALALMHNNQPKQLNMAMAGNEKRMLESAKEFEAVFISEMMKPMFEGIKTEDSMFGGGKGEEIFNGMMIQEYGKIVAERDVTGIQTAVKNKLIELQAARTANEITPAMESGTVLELDILNETPINENASKEERKAS